MVNVTISRSASLNQSLSGSTTNEPEADNGKAIHLIAGCRGNECRITRSDSVTDRIRRQADCGAECPPRKRLSTRRRKYICRKPEQSDLEYMVDGTIPAMRLGRRYVIAKSAV